MRATLLRLGILLALALGTSAATAQTEFSFATGVDSTDWAQAQSNADGYVLIESPQYPRGLWLHLVDEAEQALVGLRVEYQGRPDSLVAIRCVDLFGRVQETLVWTRPDGDLLRLTLKPKEIADLPAGIASIDWRIDPNAEVLLVPEEETRLIGWEEVSAFLQARWQGQTGRVAIQLDANTLAVEVDHPKDIERLVAHLQQVQQPVATSLEEISPLKMQVFTGNLGLREGVILFHVPLFEDSNLERVVRRALRQPQGRLRPEDFADKGELNGEGYGVHNLAGLERFVALRWLYLSINKIVNLTPLAQLNNLRDLDLMTNQIADVTPIANLTNLTHLNLGGNQIIDVTPLANLNNLEILWLWGNQIADVTPLANLTKLQHLHLQNNQIIDVTPLTNLTNLRWLTLDDNQIADINSLVNLAKLRRLYLRNNPLSDRARNEQIPALRARGVEVFY